MLGMEMMMKTFGLDPAEIKAKVEGAGEDFKKVVAHFDARLNIIESKIDYLITCAPNPNMLAKNSEVNNVGADQKIS